MTELRFRGDITDEAERQFRLRELLRGRSYRPMPTGSDGFVVEDLDLVLRWYGPSKVYPDLDATGRVRLVEVKYRNADLGTSKTMTFGLIDRLMRGGDMEGMYYDGFYVVRFDDANFDGDTTFDVNGVTMTCDQFLSWGISPFSKVPPLFRGDTT